MTDTKKSFFRAFSTLNGMIIGVGIFGVPFVAARAGYLLTLIYLAVFGCIILLVHLFYGEVILRTTEKHRLVGFAEKYLGRTGRNIALLVTTFGFYGALVAYIIVSGRFLFDIFGWALGGSEFLYQVLFFVFMALFVFVGLKLISSIELFMVGFLFLTLLIIIVLGASHIRTENLITVDWNKFFLPYGVVLFSLGGSAAIPELRDILRRSRKNLKWAIVLGTLVPVVLTALFGLVVVGVSGAQTTEEAIHGLRASLGQYAVIFGALFGFFAIATSFLVIALNLKEQFWYDLKLNKHLSWALACFVPFLIFLIASPGFIQVIGFTGAVFSGLNGVLIALMYLKAKKMGDREPEYRLKIPNLVSYMIMLVFALGVVYEIWQVL